MTHKIELSNNTNSLLEKLPVGYSPISEIRGAMFSLLPVPFSGVGVWCVLACLNATQIEACGDLSCLYISEEKEVPVFEERMAIYNAQEALCKASLVYPTFDSIIEMITGENFVISEKEKLLEDSKKELEKTKDSQEKKDLLTRIENLELFLGFLFPSDAMAFIASYALGVDITDVRKLSKDMLLTAAMVASNNRNAPSNNVSGVFTDFQKKDIDKTAWYLFSQFQEEKRKEEKLKKGGFTWITGKGKKDKKGSK